MSIRVTATDKNEEPNGEVMLVAFNAQQQRAIDAQDNIWRIDGWFDSEGDELNSTIDSEARYYDPPDPSNIDWYVWENEVEYVTAYSDHLGDRVWTAFRPDDFDRPSEG